MEHARELTESAWVGESRRLALEEEARAAGLQLEGDDTVESENGEGDDGCEPRGDGMLMEVDTNGPAAQ